MPALFGVAFCWLISFFPFGFVRPFGVFQPALKEIFMNKQMIRGFSSAGVLSLAASAHAALPESVSTAVTGAQADGVVLVGLLAAAGAAVFIISKVLKRFGVFL